MPQSVTEIGEGAFSGCSSLEYITIPENVISLDTNQLFKNCSNLKGVVLPSSTTSIGDEMFLNAYKLESITIPENVTTIGEKAFNRCNSLQSVNIPHGVSNIATQAFSVCPKLTRIEIPNIVSSLENYAFIQLSSPDVDVHVYYEGKPEFLRLIDPNYDSEASNKFYRGNNRTSYVFHFQYSITYDGADVPEDAPKTFYSDDGDVTLPNPINPIVPGERRFSGWYDNASFEGIL